MIALLLANRTLAEAVGALFLIGAMWAAWIHHDHAEQRIGENTCEARLTLTKVQAQAETAAQLAHYETTIQPAEKEHAKDLAAIPLRVVTTPIWLHDGQICAGPLSGVSQTASSDSPGGGAVEGPGRDIRPLIEQFKAKYETALADCRRLDSEWPR
jgi:hypothetical protein